MEYYEFGSLDRINRENLKESDIQWYLAQILLGIEHLHNQKIVHRVKFVSSNEIGSEVCKHSAHNGK